MRFFRSLQDAIEAARRAKVMAEDAGDLHHVAFLQGEIEYMEAESAHNRRIAREKAAGYVRPDRGW